MDASTEQRPVCAPASVYAKAAGKSVRWVSQLFAQAGTVPEPILTRGQPANGYRSDALPVRLFDALETVRQKKAYISIHVLLFDVLPAGERAAAGQPFARFAPALPMERLHEEEVRRARLLCAALAPVLSEKSARHASVAELARRACEQSPTLLLAPRTLRGIIQRAIERDGNLREFTRPELYLVECPRERAANPAPDAREATATDARFARLCAAVRDFSAPTRAEANAIWTRASEWLTGLVPAAGGERAARKLVFRALKKCGVHLAESDDSLRRTFTNKLAAHAAAGQVDGDGDPAIRDRRKGSAGRSVAIPFTPDESLALQYDALQKNSVELALSFFHRNPACCPETRALLLAKHDDAARRRRKPRWSLEQRRAAAPTPEAWAKFRSSKALLKVSHCNRRSMEWIDEAGNARPMVAGTLYESDDMSSNEPFRWHDPETGEVQVGRQTLCTMDVYSAMWLAASPVGRVRDAYRAEDQAEHMLETVRAHGLPDFWRLERGPWDNNFINGIKLDNGSRWGGLDALFGVLRAWTPRQKGGIEGGFRFLQSLQAHRSLSIGTKRGEFDDGTRSY